MAFAQGSRTGLSFISETTFGTTPAGNFTALPINTHSINLTKDRVQSNEIQSDRMTRTDRHGNKQIGGELVGELRKGDFDTLIESVMFNTFSSNVVKVGTTPRFFSLEDALNDVNQYRLFTGCAATSMAINITPNQPVLATFGIVGKDMSISGTGKTITAASSNEPFDAYSGSIAIGNVGASTTNTTITSIEFTIENSMAPTFVVGSDSTPQLEYGMAAVSGTMTAYFEDDSLINRFLNETLTEISVSVNDPSGSNAYTFLLPSCKINTGNLPLENPQSRVLTLEFSANYDATEATNLSITRTNP